MQITYICENIKIVQIMLKSAEIKKLHQKCYFIKSEDGKRKVHSAEKVHVKKNENVFIWMYVTVHSIYYINYLPCTLFSEQRRKFSMQHWCESNQLLIKQK